MARAKDSAAVVTEQTADNSSTNAVEAPPVSVTTENKWFDADVTVVEPTPTDPIVMTLGWLPETKVIGPAEDQPAAKPSPKAETK